ncbi:MAG: hypothetical protein MK160_04415 [Rhodobacteraceae bacterium]|nr:hypothetical protein [Paracoccaceae bacterium]
MTLYPALLGGVIATLLGGGLLVLFVDARIGRGIGLAVLVTATFWLGIQYEKFGFVQRHATLCQDKQGAYFRMFNGFDPFCPRVRF